MKHPVYFPHDTNAQHDEKILRIREKFGWEGYGLFWAVVERMRESRRYKIGINSIGGLAISLGVKCTLLNDFMSTCIDYGLFEKDSECIWSNSLIARMEEIERKHNERVGFGKLGAERRWLTYSQPIGNPMGSQCKVNKSKVNKIPIQQERIDKIIHTYAGLRGLADSAYDLGYERRRYTRAIKDLLAQFENDESAIECLNWIADYFKKKELSWTIETVVKYIPEYKSRGESQERRYGKL